ncbi:hypothetical protein V6N13_047044 [Hibiscus sabdariffa]|uniref:Uncharacterized protein n=1 Tax=Hibiscus sabdariffa TaxID=183260 RepID=A0ABR2CA90_9ROSI
MVRCKTATQRVSSSSSQQTIQVKKFTMFQRNAANCSKTLASTMSKALSSYLLHSKDSTKLSWTSLQSIIRKNSPNSLKLLLPH